MDNKRIWRKDITGLRALAVLPVIVFHAFPDVLPGGFYGVDVFFVISGYLISGIIFKDLNLERFSFSEFYIKRIKRIAPCLISVLMFVVVVGWFITTAGEFRKIAANVTHSAFFYQNFSLMREGDYFGLDAQENPLLHIWSLSIEEQFYIIFPLMCYVVWKKGNSPIFSIGFVVLCITVLSFVTCFLIDDPITKFYFSGARFWELGVGICIAYAECLLKFDSKRYSKQVINIISIIGFILICLAFIIPVELYGAPAGVFSIVPVVGSGLLIFANTKAIINRSVLSFGWVSYIGLISYSLYLWHWPLFAYVHIYFYKPTSMMLVITLVGSFLIAIVSYRWIETPVRCAQGRRSLYLTMLLFMSLIFMFLIGKDIRKNGGFPNREIAQEMSYADDWSDMDGLKKSLLNKNMMALMPDEPPEIIFVGDSHVEQYNPRAVDLAKEKNINIAFLTEGNCLLSIGVKYNGVECKKAKNELKDLIKNSDIKTLVIGQMWGSYDRKLVEKAIYEYNNLIADFLENGKNRKVYVLLDNPWGGKADGDFEIEKYFANRYRVGEKLLKNYEVNLPLDDSWNEGNKLVKAKMLSSVLFIKTSDRICPSGKCDLKNYKDSNHLRASYVKENAVWIDPIFN